VTYIDCGFFSQPLRDPEVAATVEKAQALVENLGPQEAAKFYAEEERKWSEVARVAKIGN
jgi:hypothetical protein